MKSVSGFTARRWLVAGLLVGMAGGAQATLLGRDINGNPVAANDASAVFEYDTDLTITWLRNWNAGAGSSYDNGSSTSDGRMTWQNAFDWATNLTVGIFSGWRLPTTDTGPSSNCDNHFGVSGFPDQYYGYNCTGSEMGHVWYGELGGTAGSSLSSIDPFENLRSDYYWSGTEYAPNATTNAWYFVTDFGFQNSGYGKDSEFYAVAVRPGDVAAAPEPGSLAVLLAGLVALSAARRRRPS